MSWFRRIHRPVTAEVQVRSWGNPCQIFNRRNSTEARPSSSTAAFPCQYYFTNASHLSYGQVGESWESSDTLTLFLIKGDHLIEMCHRIVLIFKDLRLLSK